MHHDHLDQGKAAAVVKQSRWLQMQVGRTASGGLVEQTVYDT